MMLFNEITWLHEHLPRPFLRLWGSSEKLVFASMYLAYGGKLFNQYYELLKKMENWSFNRIYEFQFERLKNILEHSYKNVPYYKDVFDREQLKPSDIKCLEDLQKLPVLTKEDILVNYNKFFARNLWYKRRMYRPTSGTSGRSLKVCIDESHWVAACAAIKHIKSYFLNYTPGKEIVLHIPPAPKYPTLLLNAPKKYSNFYSPVTKQALFLWNFMDNETFEQYIKMIQKFNIKHIEGFPSVFFAFAQYLRGKNEGIQIKTFSAKGEMLYKFQRKFIEKQLGCEIFDSYGQQEATIISSECFRHKGMHISPLLGIPEIKGKGLKGKGEIVMTNLWNFSWPLIRYITRDIVVLSQKGCSCGCNFPRLMSINGRTNDFITLPNGKQIHSSPFGWLSVSIPGIKDIFFSQNEDYSLDIFVVKEEIADSNKIRSIIKKRLEKLLKNNLDIQIIFTDCIKRKSNKYRVVESDV